MISVEKHYTTAEVAEICKVTSETVSLWCYYHKIEATKPGKQWLISESALQTFLEKRHA